MTAEAQRASIAKACGWTVASERFDHIKQRITRDPPDYLSDLNAMHEAEKALTPEQRRKYIGIIFNLPVSECESNMFATASQRAKAFLRTLARNPLTNRHE
jgi:hypothetical protein